MTAFLLRFSLSIHLKFVRGLHNNSQSKQSCQRGVALPANQRNADPSQTASLILIMREDPEELNETNKEK